MRFLLFSVAFLFLEDKTLVCCFLVEWTLGYTYMLSPFFLNRYLHCGLLYTHDLLKIINVFEEMHERIVGRWREFGE